MNGILEVTELLSTFDYEEVKGLLESQILSETEEIDTTIHVNHFTPLYNAYKDIHNQDIDEDIRKELQERFIQICKLFISIISKKFGVDVSETYLDDNEEYIPAIALAVYSAFVVDLKANLSGIIFNYITKNYKTIYTAFEDLKSKKDASTLSSKKELPTEYNIINSNIFVISEWILDNLTEDEFLEYLETEYVFRDMLIKLYKDGELQGNFCETIAELYKNSYLLKGSVSIDISTKIKNKFSIATEA